MFKKESWSSLIDVGLKTTQFPIRQLKSSFIFMSKPPKATRAFETTGPGTRYLFQESDELLSI